MNAFMRNWLDRVRKKVAAENICPWCQSVRFLVIAVLFSSFGSLLGAFAATSVAAFFFLLYQAYRYRWWFAVQHIRLRIWWLQRQAERGE